LEVPTNFFPQDFFRPDSFTLLTVKHVWFLDGASNRTDASLTNISMAPMRKPVSCDQTERGWVEKPGSSWEDIGVIALASLISSGTLSIVPRFFQRR